MLEAISALVELNALSNDHGLTPLGYHLAALPVRGGEDRVKKRRESGCMCVLCSRDRVLWALVCVLVFAKR